MRLLRLVQHLSFSYSSGDFLTGVRNISTEHRILVVTLGGIAAGLSLYCLRRITGGAGAEVTGAIWHKQGQFEAAPTIAKSLISIVVVGMGAAIGREAALKDTGATVAGKISDWTSLSPEQRLLLVACGAGAGMAAAYVIATDSNELTAIVHDPMPVILTPTCELIAARWIKEIPRDCKH
jgi:chloride channel protein, CIC family